MSIIFGIVFAITISVILPLTLCVYAFYKKRAIPFILGVVTFVVSQVLLRIPLLNYLNYNTDFVMFSMTNPISYILLIGFSAGIFEEVARYIAMRFVMNVRSWSSGFFFGAGHGGIEAILFVGLPVVSTVFTTTLASGDYFIGGVERFFAILLHIGLSIIVLQGVVQRRLRYLIMAILIHGIVDTFVGIAPMLFPPGFALWAIEGLLMVVSVIVIAYSIQLKRKGEL